MVVAGVDRHTFFPHSNTKEVKRKGELRGFVGCVVCIHAAGSHISCVQLTLV